MIKYLKIQYYSKKKIENEFEDDFNEFFLEKYNLKFLGSGYNEITGYRDKEFGTIKLKGNPDGK